MNAIERQWKEIEILKARGYKEKKIDTGGLYDMRIFWHPETGHLMPMYTVAYLSFDKDSQENYQKWVAEQVANFRKTMKRRMKRGSKPLHNHKKKLQAGQESG